MKRDDLRPPIGKKLPDTYSEGSPADKFVCVAPKGCYHAFRYFGFGDIVVRQEISNELTPIPRHFVPHTQELMLKIKDRLRKQALPVLNLRGEEV